MILLPKTAHKTKSIEFDKESSADLYICLSVVILNEPSTPKVFAA